MPEEDKQNTQNMNLAKGMAQLNARLRILEETISNTRDKVEILNDTLMKNKRALEDEMKDINIKTDESFKEIDNMKNIMRQMIKQLESFATKREVLVLQKYVDLFDPIKFISKEEIEELIDIKLSDKGIGFGESGIKRADNILKKIEGIEKMNLKKEDDE